MLDPLAIIKARDSGEVRYSVLSAFAGLATALRNFGLKPNESGLSPFTAQQAQIILKNLLWKDDAYQSSLPTHSGAAAAIFKESAPRRGCFGPSGRGTPPTPNW
jgi:hypothetical protein